MSDGTSAGTSGEQQLVREVEATEVDTVRIELPVGRVELTEGEPGRVHGTLCGPAEAVRACRVEARAGELQIVLDRRSWRLLDDLELRLAVPAGVDLGCRTGAARLLSRVRLGRSEIETGAGDVTLDEVGELQLRTGAGDVDIDTVTGPTRMVSGAGAARVRLVRAPLSARTGAGSIAIGRLEAPLEGASAAGPLTVAAAVDSVRVRTAAGPISIGIGDGLPAHLDLRSGLGRVEVDLPPSPPPGPGEPSLTVHARSAMGGIRLHRA